jgi:hypothetical protein
MDFYPFHHKNLFFNIITDMDLTFKEVRGILDYLLAKEAFKKEAEDWGEGKLYDFSLDGVQFEVDVNCYEVIVYRRTVLSS